MNDSNDLVTSLHTTYATGGDVTIFVSLMLAGSIGFLFGILLGVPAGIKLIVPTYIVSDARGLATELPKATLNDVLDEDANNSPNDGATFIKAV